MTRLLLSCLLSAGAACAFAAVEPWLTIYGFPEEPNSDVVQIAPSPTKWSDQVTVQIRVTRSRERQAYDGGTYRSHEALAVIDCKEKKGWYLSIKFYSQPNWQGPARHSRNFRPDEAPVAFRDLPTDPAQKLVTAACGFDR